MAAAKQNYTLLKLIHLINNQKMEMTGQGITPKDEL